MLRKQLSNRSQIATDEIPRNSRRHVKSCLTDESVSKARAPAALECQARVGQSKHASPSFLFTANVNPTYFYHHSTFLPITHTLSTATSPSFFLVYLSYHSASQSSRASRASPIIAFLASRRLVQAAAGLARQSVYPQGLICSHSPHGWLWYAETLRRGPSVSIRQSVIALAPYLHPRKTNHRHKTISNARLRHIKLLVKTSYLIAVFPCSLLRPLDQLPSSMPQSSALPTPPAIISLILPSRDAFELVTSCANVVAGHPCWSSS
jgi:hypothetical protein